MATRRSWPTRSRLRVADYVVTEAGFGADMGGEKFFDIKCRASGLWPAAAVVVATVRALKSQTGKYKITPGKPLPPELLAENPDDVYAGGANLRKQIANARLFGVPVVVALNAFPDDKPSEIEAVRRIAQEAGAVDMAVSTVFAEGGQGGLELAQQGDRGGGGTPATRRTSSTRLTCRSRRRSTPSRPRSMAPAMSASASRPSSRSRTYEANGFGNLPICMAKTHLSLSHDPALKGVPTGYTFHNSRGARQRRGGLHLPAGRRQ